MPVDFREIFEGIWDEIVGPSAEIYLNEHGIDTVEPSIVAQLQTFGRFIPPYIRASSTPSNVYANLEAALRDAYLRIISLHNERGTSHLVDLVRLQSDANMMIRAMLLINQHYLQRDDYQPVELPKTA